MTRLVVHAGTPVTDWALIHRQLVSWRAPLRDLGMRLHPADDASSWLSGVRNLARGRRPRHLVQAVRAAVRNDASAVLVSSARLEDTLRDPVQLGNLTAFAADLGMPLTVLVVIRDQLGCLNALYCDRVAHLQTARDFPSFVAELTPAGRFDYATAFSELIAAPKLDLVAIPYPELQPGAPAKALLVAAGLTAADVQPLPEPTVGEELPGPVLVASLRLLFKRLWQLGLLETVPRHTLQDAAQELRVRADDHVWDDNPFWGWDNLLREAAIARYRPGNDVLAEAVWGRPWGDAWETGTYVDVDLPASPPGLVVDVLGTVDLLVRQVRAAKPKGASGQLCQNADE